MKKGSGGLSALEGWAKLYGTEGSVGDLFSAERGDRSHSALTPDPIGDSALVDTKSIGGENLSPEVLDERSVNVHSEPCYGNNHIMVHGYNPLQDNGQRHDHVQMNFGQRLKAARKYAGLTQKRLGEIVGIDQTTISDFERGKSGSSSHCAKIADACGVNPLWLETGGGEMLSQAIDSAVKLTETPDSFRVLEASVVQREQVQYVPLVSWVAAGMWREAIDRHTAGCTEDYMLCPDRIGPRGFALRVEGDSMTSPYPGAESYPHGTYIYIDPDIAYKSGDPVIAKLPGSNSATFKIYVEDAGRIYLKPLNPQHPMIPITEETHIVGVLVGSYRKR